MDFRRIKYWALFKCVGIEWDRAAYTRAIRQFSAGDERDQPEPDKTFASLASIRYINEYS